MLDRRQFMKAGTAAAGALSAWGCTRSQTATAAKENKLMPPATQPATASLDVDRVKLIEAHGHIETPEGVALMRRERLSYALIMATKPATYELARQNPDLMGLCVWLDMNEKDYLAPARTALKDYPDVVKGLKIHPAGKYEVTYDLAAPLFAFANEHGLMIQTHTMKADQKDWCSAGSFRPLLKKYPATRLVLAHGTPAEQAFALTRDFENVYLDCSYTAWGREYARAARQSARRERMLFGIDSPVGFPKNPDGTVKPHFRDAAREVAAFWDHDPAWLEGIFWRNGEHLLGFTVPDRTAAAGA